MSYKALSIKQPWATLLAHGRKTIEVRRWRPRFRGELLLHAARIPDPRPEAWAHVPPELREEAQQGGGIVGVGRLDSCKVYRTLPEFVADQGQHLNDPSWFEPRGLFGLCFTELRVMPFRQVPGYVKIFPVELDDLEIPPPPIPAFDLARPEDGLGVGRGAEEVHGSLAAVLQRFPWLTRLVAQVMGEPRTGGSGGKTE